MAGSNRICIRGLALCRISSSPAPFVFLLHNRYPLYKPCKCSGSIGLVHQDCLESWLEVQRGDGKCELCKTQFQFAPQYAQGTPDQLPAIEVFSGLARRCMSRWLPFVLRILFAASLWLVVAPLFSAYLYQGWINKPQAIFSRLEWRFFFTDLISGLVVIALVILSFLSLVSFADFLREEWQHNGLRQGGERRRHAREARIENEPRRFPADEHDVDNALWQYYQQLIVAHPAPLRPDRLRENDDALHLRGSDEDSQDSIEREEDESSDSSYYDEDEEDEEEDDLDDVADDVDPQPPLPAFGRDDPGAGVPQNEPRPFVDDPNDPGDAGINLALDEVLGFRGPLANVFQNMFWLLGFVTIYLGFFTFAPRIVGSSVFSFVFNIENQENNTHTFNATEDLSIAGVFKAIENESRRIDAPFRIRDFVTVILGYLALAAGTLIIRGLYYWTKKFHSLYTGRGRNAERDDLRAAFDDMHRLAQALAHENQNFEPEVAAIGIAIGVALDALKAVIKVGLLLFMKMFLLPIVLGIALDASTISLLGGTIEARVEFAGRDLFTSLLLHWVAGITFMLLVTVSVLQLREVVHPELLAQVIRPQEPQPDLLGNLLHETAGTHAKRMLLSLIIYSLLLFLHIRIPVNLLLSAGVQNFLAFFELKFCYIITPQLQTPLELLVFHLCMLAVLEKNKNSIGELQHYWLKKLSHAFGLTDALMPRQVDSFRLIGTRSVFVDDSIDDFWYKLSKEDKEHVGERLLFDNLSSFRATPIPNVNQGETKPNGERVLRFGAGFIRLPKRLPGRAYRSRSVLLPTKYGRFRLKRDLFNNVDPVIQLWVEVPGEPIPRPPDGWDDLGAGGADIQGRWSWGREKKSTIERGVAQRSKLFERGQGPIGFVTAVIKLIAILLLSWCASVIFLSAVLGGPLAIGRMLYAVLRVPESWIHDPFGFAVGSLVFFPCAKTCAILLYRMETPSLTENFAAWARRLHSPPFPKVAVFTATIVSWFGLSPLLLGFIYELTFVKDSEWFTFTMPIVDSWFGCWSVGFFLLNIWGYGCSIGLFTPRFWLEFLQDNPNPPGQGANEAGEADERAAAWVDNGNGHLSLQWQGRHGRLASFYDTLLDIVFLWEWDKLDSTVLLSQCAVPVLIELGWIALAAPVIVWLGVWRFPGMITTTFTRLVLARAVLVEIFAYKLMGAYRQELTAWFEAAHKTARDDRYLIGKILLNYAETVGRK